MPNQTDERARLRREERFMMWLVYAGLLMLVVISIYKTVAWAME